jgi:hypothetical protein
MEENAIFRIPTSGSLSDATSTTVATITPVELNSAPLNVATETKKQAAPSPASIYDELSAISEEVLACRKAVLERI